MGFPSVADTLKDKVILLTGASGFVGKALLEKLARSCPGIKAIYVILRAGRNGASPSERLQEMLAEHVFDKVREAGLGDRLTKMIIAVAGDCAEEGLGLSEDDRALLQDQVDVIVHSAASVRFDDPLKKAILLNTRGTRDVAALATTMPKLKVLVHVSTTYCNTHQPVIEERVYPMPPETRGDWRQLVHMAETMSEKEMDEAVSMGYQPNTYTFSKALAEQVIADYSDRLNVAIFRPSMVTGAVAEPMPGWANSLNGPFALSVGITKGLVHTTLANKEAVIDIVVVEMVVNGIILAAREGILNPEPRLRVCNCSAAHRKTLSVLESIDCALKSNALTPHDRTMWHPFVVVTGSLTVFTLLSILLHFVPALILDTVLRLIGRRPWLVRMYWKVYKAVVSLRYFTLEHWVFENANFYALRRTLSPEDYATFKLDFSDVDPVQYLHTHQQYIRRYILKENMDPKVARRNQTTMYVVDRCARALGLLLLGALLVRIVYAIAYSS